MAALLVACVAFAAEPYEDVVEKTFPLDPAGSFRLQGIDGSAFIYGTDSSEVKIVATKKAFSIARLNQIEIRIEKKGDALKVETLAPPKARGILSDRSGTVDFVITVPQTARIAAVDLPNGEILIDGMRGRGVAVALGSGRLVTRNCFCDQTLRLQTGVLELQFDWQEERAVTLDAAIGAGNVRALIPDDAEFELNAVAEHGQVASDFSASENRKRGGVSEVHERFGANPATKLNVRAKNGNIRITEIVW